MVPQGKCPKCGSRYYGWGLNNVKERKCPVCGCFIEVQNTDEIITGDAPPITKDTAPTNDQGGNI